MDETKQRLRNEHTDLAFEKIAETEKHVRAQFAKVCQCVLSEILERFTTEELEIFKKFLLVELASNAIICGSAKPELQSILTFQQGVTASYASHVLDTLDKRKVDVWAEEIS